MKIISGKILAASLIAGFGPMAADAMPAQFQRNQWMVPSVKGTTVPLPPLNSSELVRDIGILRCNLAGSVCYVRNMPLLAQGDPKLAEPLLLWLKTIADDQLPLWPDDKGDAVVGPDGKPRRYSREDVAKFIQGYGCYDTSIVSVILAAAANRAPDLTPAGRTADFLGATQPNNTIPRNAPLVQLYWQYQQAAGGQNGWMVRGKPAKPYHMMEAAADFGGGISQNCDPYAYGDCDRIGGYVTGVNGRSAAFRKDVFSSSSVLSKSEIIELMSDGWATMVAYNRYKVVSSFEPSTGTLRIEFENVPSYHKVVFYGYKPGDFPLVIHDVGSDENKEVALSAPAKNLPWTLPAGVARAQVKQVVIDPAFASKVALFERGQYANGVATQVFFVDHIDGLKLATETRGASSPNVRINPLTRPPLRPFDIRTLRAVDVDREIAPRRGRL